MLNMLEQLRIARWQILFPDFMRLVRTWGEFHAHKMPIAFQVK